MINKLLANQVVKVAMNKGIPLQLAKLMACQSAFETANFKSNAFRKNNNGFGYKYFKDSAYQLGKGITSTEKDPNAAYQTFDNSIEEVCAWIKRRQRDLKFPFDLTKIQTPEDYAHLLKACNYFGSEVEHYAKGLNKYLKQIEDEKII